MASHIFSVVSLRATAVAAGLLLCGLLAPAHAQILDPPSRSLPKLPVKPKPAQSAVDDPDEALRREQEDAFYDGSWGRTQVRPAAGTLLDEGETDPESKPAAEDGGQPVRDQAQIDEATKEEEERDPADVLGSEQARFQRLPPPQDGDAVNIMEPMELPDGTINLEETYAAANAEDSTLADMRNPRDIVVFSGLDAGFDPLLLQAQETNPVFSSGGAGPFGIDPFAPLGTRIGSFTLFTSVEADGDYNSNIFASPEALGDTSLEVRPAGRLVSNWATHALEVRASGDLSFHDKYPSEDDRAYLVEGLGRIDITRQTDLQGLVAHEEAQEGRSAINATSTGTRPNVTVDRGRASFNHTFNRLSVQLRGAIIDTNYGTNLLNGVTQSNADRDYMLYDEAFRPQWEFSPTFLIFADLAFNQRNYEIAAFTDGLNRTSTGERYRFGVSFGNTGQILRGEISLGYGHQAYDSSSLPPVDGLLIDGNLIWNINWITSLALTMSTDVAETTTVGSGGVLERNYAAELRHNFGVRLIGSIGLSYFTRDFIGGDLSEDQFSAATGLEYYMNRNAVLFGRYQHQAFNTTSLNGNYTTEIVQLGVRLRN